MVTGSDRMRVVGNVNGSHGVSASPPAEHRSSAGGTESSETCVSDHVRKSQ